MPNYHGHPRGVANVMRVSNHRPAARTYGNYHGHSSSLWNTADNSLCCCIGLTAAVAACADIRVARALVIAAVAVVVISCLAALAMSVTAEALLSVFLIGLVIYGVASLCKGSNCCHPQDTTNATPRVSY